MNKLAWLLVILFGAAMAGCSSGGGAPVQAQPQVTPPATATPTPTPSATPGSMELEIYVPGAAETPAASANRARRPMFVSPNTQSLVATITEPDVEPSALQNRTEPHNVKAGFNSITLYAPPGTVTIVLRLYSQANGLGAELGRSDPGSAALQNIVLDGIHPVQLSVTIDPIVVGAFLAITSISRPSSGCMGATGQAITIGVDPSGAKVYGAGKFLNTKEQPVTYRISPASPPDISSPDAIARVFTTPLSIGGTVADGVTAVPFAESNPAYDENTPATFGTYAWYDTLTATPSTGPAGAAQFDAIQCLPGVGG